MIMDGELDHLWIKAFNLKWVPLKTLSRLEEKMLKQKLIIHQQWIINDWRLFKKLSITTIN
jgi:hypothetical protein